MTQNDLMTAGAVGFALFAVLYLKKQAGAPVAAVSAQPAQRQRDAGLTLFLGNLQSQERLGTLTSSGLMSYGPDFSGAIDQWKLLP